MKPLVPLLLGSLLLTLHNVYAQTSAPPVPAPLAQGQPIQIDRNGVLILIRSNLLALDHANRTGNYTVLGTSELPDFRRRTQRPAFRKYSQTCEAKTSIFLASRFLTRS